MSISLESLVGMMDKPLKQKTSNTAAKERVFPSHDPFELM